MEKKWKSFCLVISPDTHRRIEKEVLKKEGATKTQWIREAIAEKFERRKEK
jgi:predicted DNA-binding protein